MAIITKEISSEISNATENLKSKILAAKDEIVISGKVYYVSDSGDDANDGLTPETAWKTTAKVSSAKLESGDGVRFKRGDLFRGKVKCQPGVTYAAYGEGEKPKIYGWDKDLADKALWTLVDKNHNIWKLNEKILDPGTLVFNHGEAHSVKLIPSYIGGKFVCRDDESRDFDMKNEMVRDLDIFWYFVDRLTTVPSKGKDFPIPVVDEESYGELYLRCDKGNPGEIYSSIEALTKRPCFLVGSNENVRIDNICIKYIGHHAVAAGGFVKGLHVTNCEIGWIGGTIQNFSGEDPNYPQGGRGTVVRFGNGVEIYGGCDDYEVSNCYIYESYDAAITHQFTTEGKEMFMKNIVYKDNLIEKNVYGIEYFLNIVDDSQSYMENIEICGNIMTKAGEGWGQQRHNVHTPALIKGWSYINTASNFSIHNNIFDRSAYRMLHLVALKEESLPEMYENTYVQYDKGMIGQYGANEIKEPDILYFNEDIENTVKNVFGDEKARVYTIK